MALNTSNRFGNITISDDAVSMIVSRVALDCYGIVELAARRLSDSILLMFNKEPVSKGVKIVTMDNRVYVDLYAIIKKGVNQEAVKNSLISSVKYNIEHLTGMRVKGVNVHIVGVKL